MKKLIAATSLIATASFVGAAPMTDTVSDWKAIGFGPGSQPSLYVDANSIALRNDGRVSYWEMRAADVSDGNVSAVEYQRIGRCGGDSTSIQASRTYGRSGALVISQWQNPKAPMSFAREPEERSVLAFACSALKEQPISG